MLSPSKQWKVALLRDCLAAELHQEGQEESRAAPRLFCSGITPRRAGGPLLQAFSVSLLRSGLPRFTVFSAVLYCATRRSVYSEEAPVKHFRPNGLCAKFVFYFRGRGEKIIGVINFKSLFDFKERLVLFKF